MESADDLLLTKNYGIKTSKMLVIFMERITRLPKSPARKEYVAHIREREKQSKGEPKMLLSLVEEEILEEKWLSGIERGKLEGELKGKFATARRLRDYGMNLEQIQAMTDLTDEQMKTL